MRLFLWCIVDIANPFFCSHISLFRLRNIQVYCCQLHDNKRKMNKTRFPSYYRNKKIKVGFSCCNKNTREIKVGHPYC